MSWVILNEEGALIGWPKPLVYRTRKEAKAAMLKIRKSFKSVYYLEERDVPFEDKRSA